MIHGYIPSQRFLPYLSWTDLESLPNKENTVIVLPVGAIEQHGAHLPCSVDATIAAGVVGKALEKLPSNIPAFGLPTIYYGKSDEHIHFPGTLTISGENLLHMIQDIGESVYRAGFRKLLMVNAHGGQPQPLEMAARELRIRHGDFMVIPEFAWNVEHDTSEFSEDETNLSLHAGHGETALMLALLGDYVDMSKAKANFPTPFPVPSLTTGRPVAAWTSYDFGPSGVIGDPTNATLALGKKLLEQLGSQWAQVIKEIHCANWVKRDAMSWGRSSYSGFVNSNH